MRLSSKRIQGVNDHCHLEGEVDDCSNGVLPAGVFAAISANHEMPFSTSSAKQPGEQATSKGINRHTTTKSAESTATDIPSARSAQGGD